MPLSDFVAAAIGQLETHADEILVEQAPEMRATLGPGEHGLVIQFNNLMSSGAPLG